jgi:hypothetical protein
MATVTGTVEGPDGVLVKNGRITFLPISTPMRNGTRGTLTYPVYATTDSNGQFSVTLRPGEYEVDHNLEIVEPNREGPLVIRVPNEDSTFDWFDLVRSYYHAATEFGGVAAAVDERYVVCTDGSIWKETFVRQGSAFTTEQTLISEAP